ncbi:MAG: electron transfer flavoprotein subunit beta/FixA family protein [Dehalococcoidales bacterium]|nr:electron transfer flavoprotein subunit beta/FixA family protein [Dehalococcoidales bacterium]
MLNIIVCVKQVIDPEALPSSFSIDPATKTARMRGANPVIDPFAEYAVEAALRVKESSDAHITVISLGNDLQRDVVKKPLAMGADELILLEDEAFAGTGSVMTAAALAAAIRKTGDYGLILCGREASDTNAGQTGPGIAEILGLPCVTLARKIEINGNTARIEKVTSAGYDVVEVEMPAVVTVSNEIGEPRYPTIKGIMGAKRITPEVWKPGDIDAETGQAGSALKDLYQPVFEGSCEFIEGETPEEAGRLLAGKLREEKIL